MKRAAGHLAWVCLVLVGIEALLPAGHGIPGRAAAIGAVGSFVLVWFAKALGGVLQRDDG